MKIIRRNIAITFLLCLFTFSICQGQTNNIELAYKQYLENLLKHHPIAKQANLRLELGAAELLGAKGNLDPVISSEWNQKNFDDKLYYRQYQAELRVPTKLGIDLVGGYENSEGIFLNPENSTDNFGLWHLGVEVNVLQGLIVNERKIALEQAQVFKNLMENEQKIILNELLFTASYAYLNWQQYHYSKVVLTENISIANTYLNNTKQSFENGEKTAMDTLEAFILYQDAITFLQTNEAGLINARQKVENYLWFDEVPVSLQETTVPENYENVFFSDIANFESSSLGNHPLIMASVNKLSNLELGQKLKREKLKPKLKIKYNPLLATSDNSLAPNFSAANYKWGFDFSMPLLFRTERADIQRGEIKLNEIALDIQNKRNELQNKIESNFQQQILLQQQVEVLSQNVENYRRLLDGENEKFRFGESSVFLLNKRQEKYINGQLKLIELNIKSQIELLNYLYYSNQLIRN